MGGLASRGGEADVKLTDLVRVDVARVRDREGGRVGSLVERRGSAGDVRDSALAVASGERGRDLEV